MLKKIILWGLVIVVSVVVIGLAAVAIFLPKEKIKEMAMEKISSALNREVTVDDLSVSYLGGLGIKLNGIKISNPENFDWSQFLEAKSLDIKLQLWPLLQRKILVDRLILIEPKIALLKTRKGQLNYFFGLIDSVASSQITEDIPKESELALAAISFDNFSIENGYIEYVDDSSQTGLTVSGLDLKTKLANPENMIYQISGNFNTDSIVIKNTGESEMNIPTLEIVSSFNARIDLKKKQAILSDSEIEINGWEFDINAGIPNTESLDYFNLEVASKKKALSEIVALLPGEYNYIPDGYSVTGDLEFNAALKYNSKAKEKLKYNGNADLYNLKLTVDSLNGDFAIEQVEIDFVNDNVGLNIIGGSLDANPISGSVQLSGFDNIHIDGKINGTAELATLNKFLPEIGKPKLSGQASFDLAGSGYKEELSKFKVNGKILIKNGVYTAETLPEPIESFELEIDINPKNIVVKNLAVQSPSSQFSLRGSISDPFPYFMPGFEGEAKKPYLKFELVSRRFNTDKLFPAVVPGGSETNIAELPIDSLPPLPLPDINGEGTIKIDSLIYTEVEFSDIVGKISIKDRTINVYDVTGKAYTGQISGKMSMNLSDFENPSYNGEFAGTQIEANDFLSRFTKYGGHLYGKTDMTGAFSASGWEPEPIINSLDMSGQADFKEAKLINFDLIKKMADQLKFKTFDEEIIKDFNSKYHVKNGRISFDDFNFGSSLGDWVVNGSVGFDGTLDYSGTILLSEKVTKELLSKSGLVSGLAGLLRDKSSNRVKVPFKLSGPFSKPNISLDLSSNDIIKENIGDALKGLFGK